MQSRTGTGDYVSIPEESETQTDVTGGDEAEGAVASDVAESPEQTVDADDTEPVQAEGSSDDDAPEAEATETAPVQSESADEDGPKVDWYILKVAFNREESIADTLRKRVAMEGMSEYFEEIFVPTEDVATFTRDGKRRVTKRRLLPGYIMVKMIINDDTWFLVRETNGISDFTGAAGKPMPMEQSDIDRFIKKVDEEDDEDQPIKTTIPFKVGDRVRIKEGNFQNQEGDVDTVDEANGKVTVYINIFGRSVPMTLDHWQVEPL